jgi:hypothetical protein
MQCMSPRHDTFHSTLSRPRLPVVGWEEYAANKSRIVRRSRGKGRWTVCPACRQLDTSDPVVTAQECAHLQPVDPPSSLILKAAISSRGLSLAHCFKGQVASCGQETLTMVCFRPRKRTWCLATPSTPSTPSLQGTLIDHPITHESPPSALQQRKCTK